MKVLTAACKHGMHVIIFFYERVTNSVKRFTSQGQQDSKYIILQSDN